MKSTIESLLTQQNTKTNKRKLQTSMQNINYILPLISYQHLHQTRATKNECTFLKKEKKKKKK